MQTPARNQPQRPSDVESAPIKDDAAGRYQALREALGGELTPEFIEAMMTAADAQRAQYGPDGRGAIRVGGSWTNIGPHRSNWIQNGLMVQESDTGRIRTFLVHPTNPDVLYVLTSSGGLWKTTNFSQPRPAWTATTDAILSTSGGNAALGANPDTIYLGTGDPFDPGVGGYARRSTDGGQTWSTAIKLGASTIVPEVKVDTSGPADIVLMGTNAGLFRSTDGGADVRRRAGVERPRSGAWRARARDGWRRAPVGADTARSWYRPTRARRGPPSPTREASTAAPAGRRWRRRPGDAVVYAFAANTGNAAQTRSVPLDRRRPELDGDWSRSIRDHARPERPVTTWVGKVPTNPNPDQPNMDIMAGQAFYNQMVLVDPNDPSRNTVYIGGQLSRRSRPTAARTWTLVSNWLAQFKLPYVHADYPRRGLHHASRASRRSLFGTDGGLFVSTDGGRLASARRRTTASRRI